MTEQRNALAKIFADCWRDEALKARFLSDPKAILIEYGMAIPKGLDVKVVENTEACVYITLPHAPLEATTLSDTELSGASGGVGCCTDQNICNTIHLPHTIPPPQTPVY